LVDEIDRSSEVPVDIIDLNYDRVRFRAVPDPKGSGIGAIQRIGETARPAELFGREAYVPGTGELRDGYHIPETVIDCDKLISVAAMKTHVSGTTLGLKNYVGILPNHPSGIVRKGDIHKGDFQKGFIDLFSYHPADYVVIEGFWSTEGNGPQWGENLQHNVVVASGDPVAADAVGSAVMGFNPIDMDYLHYAARKGFGTFNTDEMAMAGEAIGDVRRIFERAAGRKGVVFAARGNRTWLVRDAADGDWQTLSSGERYIDLDAHFSGKETSKASAAAEVHSKSAQKGMLWASAAGRMTVELNGRVVLAEETVTEHRFAEHRVPVALAQGVNRIQISLERGTEGFGFTALLCDESGNSLPGLTYRADPQQAVTADVIGATSP
jgi:hypothetical protein